MSYSFGTSRNNQQNALTMDSAKGKAEGKDWIFTACGDETITYYDSSTSTPRRNPPCPPGKNRGYAIYPKVDGEPHDRRGTPGPARCGCLENGMPHLEMPPNQQGWMRGMQKGRCGHPFFLTALPGMYPAHPHDMFNIVHLYLI